MCFSALVRSLWGCQQGCWCSEKKVETALAEKEQLPIGINHSWTWPSHQPALDGLMSSESLSWSSILWANNVTVACFDGGEYWLSQSCIAQQFSVVAAVLWGFFGGEPSYLIQSTLLAGLSCQWWWDLCATFSWSKTRSKPGFRSWWFQCRQRGCAGGPVMAWVTLTLPCQ